MINSLSKILLVVGLLAMLPTDAVTGQMQMTRMPTRLEEALINPNIGAVLRAKVRANEQAMIATTRVASLPQAAPILEAPSYSNERSRFSVIKPAIEKAKSNASMLPIIEQTEMPPGIAREPAEVAFDDEVNAAPTLATRSADPALTPSGNEQQPQSQLLENLGLEQPLAPIKGQLQFRVTGVSAMVENEPADVIIEVYNPTSFPIGPVEVSVKVPEDLTITRFDKDAWLDAERRIIAFQLKRVEPGKVQKIGMKGVSQTPGQTILDVALLSGETLVAQRSVKTQVFPQQLARKLNFGDAEQSNTIQK